MQLSWTEVSNQTVALTEMLLYVQAAALPTALQVQLWPKKGHTLFREQELWSVGVQRNTQLLTEFCFVIFTIWLCKQFG